MYTFLLSLMFASNTNAATDNPCADGQLAVAKHDIEEAREAWRGAHRAYFAVDWKSRLAVADDRDVVLAEREQRWEEVRALRAGVRAARADLASLASRASEGQLACEGASSQPVS